MVELMVVVAIVGILSAVGLPQLNAAQDRAKNNAAKNEAVNAGKTCALDYLLGTTAYTSANFPLVTGTCTTTGASELTATSTASTPKTYKVNIDAQGQPSLPVEG